MGVPIAVIVAAAQLAFGAYQAAKGAKNAKKYAKMRKDYQTPDEIFKMQNLALSQASGDTAATDFLTNQIDRNFNQSAGMLSRYGDPGDFSNDMSFMFDKRVNEIMGVADKDHEWRMNAFSKVMGAKEIVSANAAAEWKSKDDALKNQMQQAAQDKADGVQNIAGGINSGISAYSAWKTEDLYKEEKVKPTKFKPLRGGRSTSKVETLWGDDDQ